MARAPKDFYEVQKNQRVKSLFLFGVVVVFYFVALGVIALALLLSLGLFLSGGILHQPHFWTRFVAADLIAAGLFGVLHFEDARRNGPGYILKRLQAATPDPSDRYHKQFLDTVDEIRLAAGLPRVNAYVLPSFAVNSLALIEGGRVPVVAVTEGLLADCTRDELEAVVAHELAHIARGDAFYLTLVCSLANLFEKLQEALEPEQEEPQAFGARRGGNRGAGVPPFLFILAVSLSALIMHLLSTLISRERELLADGAAVELCRTPDSLGRAIYKAQVKNSFIGDFSVTYTPLFIVPPDAKDIPDTFFSRLFNSHPPFMKRLAVLAAMAHKKPQDLIDEVRESDKAREQARGVLHSFEEIQKRQLDLFSRSGDAAASGPGRAGAGPTAHPRDGALAAADSTPTSVCSEAAALPPDEARLWLLATPDPQKWEGPFTMAELLCQPRFSLIMMVKNVQEGVMGKAREFPQVRLAMRNVAQNKPIDPARQNLCPRCHIPLAQTFYEGVAVRLCRKCQGKLVDMASIDRIIARREVTFSDDLVAKARAFEDDVLLNPLKKQKLSPATGEGLLCPACGYKMVARPYNYQYFIPVDKCLSCSKIWFDSDELEILQILIEKPGVGPT